jgi:hypothetical protein
MAGISRSRRAHVAWGGLVILAAGCSDTPVAPAGTDRVRPSYNTETGRLERITYDRNGDGRTDATTYMDGTAVVRAELDQNFDGTTDRWEHYARGTSRFSSPAAAGAGTSAGGALERVETTTRSDAQVTRWETYESGLLRRVEEDSDGDGRVDKWETWEHGSLRVVALDTRGKGTADRRLVYSADGQAPRLEVDATGSGVFEPAPVAR